MDFKRKALGLAAGVVAALALGVTAAPASALDISGQAYYAADGSHKQSRSERRAQKRADREKRSRDGRKDHEGEYSRDIERSKGEGSVGRSTTITNDETGAAATRERETSRDPETGVVTHTDEIAGPNGASASMTAVKGEDGHTTSTTITGADGTERSRTVDVSKDPDAQTATKSVTHTNKDGEEVERDTTITKTDDGYTRTTEFDGGAQTEVNGTYNPETGEYDRDVTRSRGEDGAPGADATLDTPKSDEISEPVKN